MFKRSITLCVGLLTCLFLMSASFNPNNANSEKTSVTPLEAFKTMRDNLQAKSEKVALNKAEQKAFKMLDKKVTKWEKKNAEKVAKGQEPKAGKSWIAALILCWLLGILGVHRFYLGYTWQGVVQLLTLGGLGIWTLIDFIRIIIKDLKPKGGDYN